MNSLEIQYQKELRRINQYIRRNEKIGFTFYTTKTNRNVEDRKAFEVVKPKRITPASVNRLKNYTPAWFKEHALKNGERIQKPKVQKTTEERELKKEQERVKEFIRHAEKKGWTFDTSFYKTPAKGEKRKFNFRNPKKPTEKTVERMKRYNAEWLYKHGKKAEKPAPPAPTPGPSTPPTPPSPTLSPSAPPASTPETPSPVDVAPTPLNDLVLREKLLVIEEMINTAYLQLQVEKIGRHNENRIALKARLIEKLEKLRDSLLENWENCYESAYFMEQAANTDYRNRLVSALYASSDEGVDEAIDPLISDILATDQESAADLNDFAEMETGF